MGPRVTRFFLRMNATHWLFWLVGCFLCIYSSGLYNLRNQNWAVQSLVAGAVVFGCLAVATIHAMIATMLDPERKLEIKLGIYGA
jgi:hypothetical protein